MPDEPTTMPGGKAPDSYHLRAGHPAFQLPHVAHPVGPGHPEYPGALRRLASTWGMWLPNWHVNGPHPHNGELVHHSALSYGHTLAMGALAHHHGPDLQRNRYSLAGNI